MEIKSYTLGAPDDVKRNTCSKIIARLIEQA